jgi:DNA polymerase V
MVAMSQFPSPAADYHEDAISLDREFVKKPSATFFVRYNATSWREGIKKAPCSSWIRHLNLWTAVW